MTTHAQNKWSLRDCIDYAISNNNRIKRQYNIIKSAKEDLRASKNSLLPTINGAVFQDLSFGRGLSSENTYTNTNVKTTSFAIAAEIPIFTGFRIFNTVKQKSILYNTTLLELQKEEDALRVNVIKAYHDVLYRQEECMISHRQLLIDSVQTERINILVQKGKASRIELARQMSALSQSRTNHIEDTNKVTMALLTLSQLMELPSPYGLQIISPEINIEKCYIIPPDIIFENACSSNAEITTEKERLKAYIFQTKIAKSDFFPTLSINAGAGSKYYDIAKSYNSPFGQQFSQNLSAYVTLNLNIPIFNRQETRYKIRKSIIESENQILILKEKEKDLYKSIQQAYFAAINSRNNYVASKDSEKSTEESLKLVIEKYENGMSDITEYNDAMKSYNDAQSKVTQAKYDFIFAIEILKFYNGNH